MRQPAARVGDPTAHGTALSGSQTNDSSSNAGSPDVEIGGNPAWRAGIDFHTCPVLTGSSPHVGGVVTQGSDSVLINGYPAARAGDVIAESDATNTIVLGEPTVLVGTGFSAQITDIEAYTPPTFELDEPTEPGEPTDPVDPIDPDDPDEPEDNETETPTDEPTVRTDGVTEVDRDSEFGIRFTHETETETAIEFEVRDGSAIDVYTMRQSEVEDHFEGEEFETVAELSFPNSQEGSDVVTLPAGDWEVFVDNSDRGAAATTGPVSVYLHVEFRPSAE